VSLVADLTKPDRARERSERDRRRTYVARFRWIESNQTAAEIVDSLARLNPPILTSIRTVERDCAAIRDDARRYLTASHFDARFEVGSALMRYEMLARKGTQAAITATDGGSRWARVAIHATQAKTQLLQDIGLIDRRIGTLLIDETQADRALTGVDLQQRYRDTIVTINDLTSEAEADYNRAVAHGDAALAERIALEATAGTSRASNGNGKL